MKKKNKNENENENIDNIENVDNNDLIPLTDNESDTNDDDNITDNNDDVINLDDDNLTKVEAVDSNDNVTIDDDDIVYFKFNTTKHKMEGKHRLKRDTIFYGKLNEEEEESEYLHTSGSDFFNKDFPIEKGTQYEMESRHFDEVESQRNLKKKIYELLKNNTDLDFKANRRKPNKQAFNKYYEMIINEIGNQYTKSEIFVELSYYFTDHIFNMYKLLYPIHATNIIMELKEKGYLNELDNMKFI